MEKNTKEFVWPEVYRPTKVSDCILPPDLQATFQEFVTQDNIPNMLLSGVSGTGKTTVARALCNELGYESLLINGSEESGIDVLRTKIKDFASTVSFSGKLKVVILDEADYLNPNSTQPALRGFIEEFSKNCRFILTCNYKNKIIPPLQSRLTSIDFKITKEDKITLAGRFFNRVLEILDEEKIDYNKKVIAEVIKNYFPDFRKTLIELQRYSVSGTIDEGILSHIADVNMTSLIEALKEKDFKKMTQWVLDNIDNDPNTLFRKFYDVLLPRTNEVPQLVVVLNDYQYKAAFVADAELNLVACLTEVMATCSFK